jgi:hypothetical protein
MIFVKNLQGFEPTIKLSTCTNWIGKLNGQLHSHVTIIVVISTIKSTINFVNQLIIIAKRTLIKI